MKSNAKRKSAASEEFVLMGNTRAVLADLWDQWKNELGQTPDVARRMMTAAIKELHMAEKSARGTKRDGMQAMKKKAKKAVKKIARKAVKNTIGKKRGAKRKAK